MLDCHIYEQYAIAVWGIGALFTGMKQAGFEADHLCLSNAKVEHVLDYTSYPMCSMPSRVYNKVQVLVIL
jgi:hypothetical protein